MRHCSVIIIMSNHPLSSYTNWASQRVSSRTTRLVFVSLFRSHGQDPSRSTYMGRTKDTHLVRCHPCVVIVRNLRRIWQVLTPTMPDYFSWHTGDTQLHYMVVSDYISRMELTAFEVALRPPSEFNSNQLKLYLD